MPAKYTFSWIRKNFIWYWHIATLVGERIIPLICITQVLLIQTNTPLLKYLFADLLL
jgi:hypothetical protein